MLLSATVLDKITTKNLIKLTIEQTQLENNFQLILKALRLHDTSMSNVNSRLDALESKGNLNDEKFIKVNDTVVKNEINANQIVTKIERQISNINHKIDQLTNANVSKSEINPQAATGKQILTLIQNIRSLEQRVESILKRTEKTEQLIKQIDIAKLEDQLKHQADRILKLQGDLSDIIKNNQLKESAPSGQKDWQKLIQQAEARINKLMQINKQQVNKLVNKLGQDLAQINKRHIPDISKIIKKLSDDIWKLNDEIYKLSSELNSKPAENDSSSRLDHLQKRVNQLDRMINFHLIQQQNSPFKVGTAKTADMLSPDMSKIRYESIQDRQLTNRQEERFANDGSDFKKEIIEKLKQQKGDFAKALKKLDNFNYKKDEDKTKLGDIEQKILKVQYGLQSKCDNESMKKWMNNIENKINYIYRIINVEAQEQDACIARKNWICLSCDKKLDTYRGKVGNHLTSGQPRGKAIENEVVGGGMLFRSKSRYEMPSIKK